MNQPRAASDAELAWSMVLRPDDLGDGWDPHRTDEASGGPDGDAEQPALDGFPDDQVTGSAVSPRFTKRQALAWSAVWVLDGEQAAGMALARLGDREFVDAFVRSAAATVEPDDGSPTLLGLFSPPALPLGGVTGVVRHRGRVVAGDDDGTLAVHLDLLALGRGRIVSLVMLGNSPDPWANGDLERLARRISTRMGAAV